MSTVSIIINTYGRDFQIIKRAIESALRQTYSLVKVYVVDDNKDESPLIYSIKEGIRRMDDSRVVYLSYPGNRGACYARNFGASHSEGEYLAFLDDDDTWHENKIEKQLEYLQNSDTVAVTCDADYVFVDKKGEIIKKIVKIKTDLERIGLNDLLESNIIGGSSWPLIRRQSFDEAGGFKEGFPSSQDYELWLRLSQVGDIGRIPESLLDYYIYPSKRISNNLNGKISSFEYIVKQYRDKATDGKQFASKKFHVLAKLLCHNGCFTKSIQYACKSFSERPSFNSLVYVPYCIAVAGIKRIKQRL